MTLEADIRRIIGLVRALNLDSRSLSLTRNSADDWVASIAGLDSVNASLSQSVAGLLESLLPSAQAERERAANRLSLLDSEIGQPGQPPNGPPGPP